MRQTVLSLPDFAVFQIKCRELAKYLGLQDFYFSLHLDSRAMKKEKTWREMSYYKEEATPDSGVMSLYLSFSDEQVLLMNWENN